MGAAYSSLGRTLYEHYCDHGNTYGRMHGQDKIIMSFKNM